MRRLSLNARLALDDPAAEEVEVVLFMIELVNTDKRAEPGRKMLDHIKGGFVYAFSHPALKYLFVIILVAAVFGRAYMDLLAGISETVFFRDPKEGVAIFISAKCN